MFWKKKAPEAVNSVASPTEKANILKSDTTSEKLPKPRDIEPRIGGQLVIQKNLKPDDVWRLKTVRSPFLGVKDRFYFRVFDDVDTANKGFNIINYRSLDEHPEFILWEGWFDKETNQVEFTDKDTKS